MVMSQPMDGAVTVKLRVIQLIVMGLVFFLIVLTSMLFFMRGVEVDSFESTAFDAETLDILQSYYNSISSSLVSLAGIPIDFLLSSLVSVFFMVFASTGYARTNRSFCMKMLVFIVSAGLKYLVSNGFNGFNAQTVMKRVVPFVSTSDMAASTYAMDSLTNITTTVSTNYVPEDIECNFIANTVLRNVIAPIILKTAPTCLYRQEGGTDSSEFAEGLMQSFGFPIRDWQQWLALADCDGTGSSAETFYPIPLKGSEEAISDTATGFLNTGMTIQTATNVFIHAMHVSRHFFRWFANESLPFNISGLIQESKQADIIDTSHSARWNFTSPPIHSISAADLLNLTLPTTNNTQIKAEWFLESARDLFQRSLTTAVNISQNEVLMKFTHKDVASNITFDAITFEVPLRRNFYYRKLVFNNATEELDEDTQATAMYTDIANAGNTSTIYYDLDMRTDCGPNPYSCVMPRVQEYDSDGHEYQPNPQIKATAICLNSNGTEDFQIDYDFYTDDTTPTTSYLHAAWACNNKSSTSMWIVSFGNRIEAHDMYDEPAPDASETVLDSHRATIENPRKVYSLTVGRFAWDTIDFEAEFTATCTNGQGKCRGMLYKQMLSLEADDSPVKYLLVGEDSIPMQRLEPFSYNNTESGGSFNSNSGTATRWVSLMTLTTPIEDALYSRKGDVILRYNLDYISSWSSEVRSGENCSLSAEDHLNHVVNNHFFMGSGMQPAYVSGLYFLFQNGVVRDIVNATASGSETTLGFDGNVMWMKVIVSTPDWSAFFSFVGLGIVFLVIGVIMVWSCCGKRAVIKNSRSISAERLAGMKISWLLDCRVDGSLVKLHDMSLVEAKPGASKVVSLSPAETTDVPVQAGLH